MVLLQCPHRTRCTSQLFGTHVAQFQGEAAAEGWLLVLTRSGPTAFLGYVSVAARPRDEVVLEAGASCPGEAHTGAICGSR